MESEEIEVRTDLWHEMDVNRLTHQRELILSKLGLLTTMTLSPSMIGIYNALQNALQDINTLIDKNITTPSQRT